MDHLFPEENADTKSGKQTSSEQNRTSTPIDRGSTIANVSDVSSRQSREGEQMTLHCFFTVDSVERIQECRGQRAKLTDSDQQLHEQHHVQIDP